MPVAHADEPDNHSRASLCLIPISLHKTIKSECGIYKRNAKMLNFETITSQVKNLHWINGLAASFQFVPWVERFKLKNGNLSNELFQTKRQRYITCHNSVMVCERLWKIWQSNIAVIIYAGVPSKCNEILNFQSFRKHFKANPSENCKDRILVTSNLTTA